MNIFAKVALVAGVAAVGAVVTKAALVVRAERKATKETVQHIPGSVIAGIRDTAMAAVRASEEAVGQCSKDSIAADQNLAKAMDKLNNSNI